MMWIPTSLLRDHWATLRSQRTGRPMKWDRRAFVALPAVVSATAMIWEVDTAPLLDATAILTALLFTLLVHVFTLGLQASTHPILRNSWVLTLIDELRINTAYAIGTGILAVVFLSAAGAYPQAPWWIQRSLAAVGTALVVHLLMTLGMVIKRTNTAYVEMRKQTAQAPPEHRDAPAG